MLSKRFESLGSIDRFYYWLGGVLVLMAILLAFVARGIFSSISLSGQIDSEAQSAPVPRLQQDQIDSALKINEPEVSVGLDL